MEKYFQYSLKELEYLKKKDKILAEAIEKIGLIYRPITPDLFEALVHSIVGQQISISAQKSIWEKLVNKVDKVSVNNILKLTKDELQSVGLSYRKVEYIQNMAEKIASKEFDLEKLHNLSDDEVCEELSSLKGIGVWTAQMIMIFSMQRKDILSYGDLAIQRGLRMLYHHREITPKLYLKYKKRYTPYSTLASLYIWAIAGGMIEDMKDYAPKKKKDKK